MSWPGHVAHVVEMRDPFKILFEKYEGKRSLELGKHVSMILKLILKEMGWECVDWIRLAEDKDQWHTHENRLLNL
jgi:hypothetical protein